MNYQADDLLVQVAESGLCIVRTLVKQMQNTKKISIVIPARNEEENIGDLLRSLLRIDYPHELLEVVVVDDDSEDNTSKIVRQFSKDHSILEIKLVRTPRRMGPGGARNLGVQIAGGEIIAFVDSDDIIHEGWLRKIANLFQRFPEISGVTGPARSAESCKENFVERCEALREHYYESLEEGLVKSGKFFRGGNMAILREVFLSLGGFNEMLFTKEDHEFGQRFVENGYKGYYSRDVVIHHKWMKSLSKVARRQFNYGRGEGSVLRTYPNLIPKDLIVFTGGFTSFLILMLVIGIHNLMWMLSIGLVAFLFYFPMSWINMRNELRHMRNFDKIFIPVYNMVMNISWSAGFLFEIFISTLKKFAQVASL